MVARLPESRLLYGFLDVPAITTGILQMQRKHAARQRYSTLSTKKRLNLIHPALGARVVLTRAALVNGFQFL